MSSLAGHDDAGTTVLTPAAVELDHEHATAREQPRGTALMVVAGIAALTAVPVIQGKLQALAVVCLLLMPFVAGRVLRNRLVRLVSVTLVLWAVGQVVSDEWNGLGARTSRQAIGALAILVLVVGLVAVGRGEFRRIRYVVAGVALGLVLETLLVEHAPVTSTMSWKFGLNTPVAVALLALTDLAWQRGRRAPSVLALGSICVLGVATDHRHLAGVAVLTGIVLLVRNRQRHPRTVSVLAGLLLLLAALSGAFIQGSQAGVLGERSGEQIAQFGGTPQSILVNVRPEPFQELYLFLQRPVLGWGSLPQLDSGTYLASKEFLRSIGVVRADLDDIWLPLEVPGLAAHSQSMDSLARAGLAAAPFWLMLVAVAVLAGVRAIRFRLSPLVVLWTITVLWDAFFSPLSGLSHIELGTYLALAITSVGPRPQPGPDDE